MKLKVRELKELSNFRCNEAIINNGLATKQYILNVFKRKWEKISIKNA